MAKVGPALTKKALAKLKAKKYELDYVDENEYYKARLSTEERFRYWNFITQRDKRRTLIDQPIDEEVVIKDTALQQEQKFSKLLEIIFLWVVSRVWDYLYIIFFLLFLIVVSLVHDAKQLPPLAYDNLSNPQLPTALLVLMLLTQIVPVFGIVYFMFYHNKRTHFIAQGSFGKWVSLILFLSLHMMAPIFITRFSSPMHLTVCLFFMSQLLCSLVR